MILPWRAGRNAFSLSCFRFKPVRGEAQQEDHKDCSDSVGQWQRLQVADEVDRKSLGLTGEGNIFELRKQAAE